MSEERCVCCGAVIPEGRQYCPVCAKKAEKGADGHGQDNAK